MEGYDNFVCENSSLPENICECKKCELDGLKDNDSVCNYCSNSSTDYCDDCIYNDYV